MPPFGRNRREPADYSGRNTQETISSLAPDAGLFGIGSFGSAPELSAAVSTPTKTATAPTAVTNTNYMDTVNASLATLNPSGLSTREPLPDDASLREKTTYYSRQDDPDFQSILSGTAEPEEYATAGARHFQTELAKGRSLGDIISTGVGVGGTVNNPYLQEYQRRLGGSPARIKIPNSSTSAAAGLEGHDDSAEVYFNPGPGVDLNKIYPNLAGKGTWNIPKGGGTPGSYDIVYTPDAYDPRAGGAGLFNDYLMPVATAVMGFYNPAFAVAQVGTKAAAGETLHLGDYASAITGGLKASGLLTAPTKAVAATATTPAVAASAGKGLLGFDYGTTVKGLNTAFAVADGDIIGGVVSQFGGDLTEKALNSVGLNKTVLDGLNINQDDLVKGMLTTEKELLKGTAFDDALLKGVGKYITEGGSARLGTGGIETPEFIKAIGNAVKDVGRAIDSTILQPIKQTMPAIEDAVRATGSAIDDAAQPLIQAAKTVADPVVEAGSAVNRAVVKPVVGAAGDVAKATGNVIQAVTEPVVDVVDDVLDSTYDAINQLDNFIDDIDLPSVNLPNVNLPNINMPNINLRGGMPSPVSFNISGGGGQRRGFEPNKKLDAIDLGFELEELETAKDFEQREYNPRGMQAI